MKNLIYRIYVKSGQKIELSRLPDNQLMLDFYDEWNMFLGVMFLDKKDIVDLIDSLNTINEDIKSNKEK